MPLGPDTEADPADIDAVLRLAANTSAADPRRRHALGLIRACGAEAPWEWCAPVYVSVAWHLVAEVLEVAPAGTVVEADTHNDGGIEDIVIWNRDAQGRWPHIVISWTTGRLRAEGGSRPLESEYLHAFVVGGGSLRRALRKRFAEATPGVSAERIAAARLLALVTDPPDPLELGALEDPAVRESWSLTSPRHGTCVGVDMASGQVTLPTGNVVDPREVLAELQPSSVGGSADTERAAWRASWGLQ